MLTYIDLIIIGLFLLFTFAIGIYYGRGIRSFQDYAVGNRKMSVTVIVLSLIATTYGGGILGSALDDFYRKGLYAFMMELVSPFNFYLASRFVILRMHEFSKNVSIAESMGSIYGPIVQVISAIFGIIMTIALLTVQIKFGQTIITAMLPHEVASYTTTILFILSILFIGYATLGGARAVAITDVYQFLLFGLCFPILIFVLLYHVKNPMIGWQKLVHLPSFNPKKIFQWNEPLKELGIYCICRSVFPFDPARIHRFYMTASVRQAAKVFNRSAMIRILLALLFLAVAVALHIGSHLIPPNQNVIDYILGLNYFPGMQGILLTVIIALLMSTADSNLHAASVLFANDIYPYMVGVKPSLKVIRMVSASIGMSSLLVVIALPTSYNFIPFLYKIVSIYFPIVTVPFIMACLGFRPRTATILLNMIIHTTVAIYRTYIGYIGSYQNLFKSIILSLFTLWLIHYLLPKRPDTGWIGIKDSNPWNLQNQITQRWWLERLRQLKSIFTKAYWIHIFPRKERTFIWLGIYCIVHAAIAIFFIQKIYWMPYIYLYMTVMATGTVIALYPAWHSYKKEGNALLYGLFPMLLFVLLFMVPLQFLKLSHYSPMLWALWFTSLNLAVALLSFQISLTLLSIALLLHKGIPPYILFGNLFSHGFSVLSIELLLAVVLIAIAVVGFGMYTYLQNKSLAKLNIIAITQMYEHRISLEAIYNQANWSRLHALDGTKLLQNLADQFKETAHELYKKHPDKLKNEIDRFVDKLYKLGDTMQWRAQEERSLKLNEDAVQPTAIEAVILKVNQYVLHLGEPLALLLRKQTSVEEIVGDPALLECLLLINLCEIAKSKQAEDHIVALTIQEAILQYEGDQEPLTLPALAFCFSTDTAIQETTATYLVSETASSSILPPSQEQFYQIESRQMVEAHGGYVEILTKPESLTCLYVLPVNGQKVIRFKTYDPVDLVVGTTAETAESVVQEKELVSLLIANTNLTQEKVVQTIAFIKKAHGLTKRKSGAPYYTHPMEVAKILLEVTKDPDTILAGLLHDVVEDTPITLHQIHLLYGEEVASMVDKVTEYNTHGYPWKLEKIEQNGILNVCGDIRVVQVKLADRLHNMRTLYARKPESQQRIAKETLTFYIPWGERNKGPKAWLREMQEICEEFLQPK